MRPLVLEIFLEKFAQTYPEPIHIIQLDNAPAHRAKTLTVLENIVLFFQPPYCLVPILLTVNQLLTAKPKPLLV